MDESTKQSLIQNTPSIIVAISGFVAMIWNQRREMRKASEERAARAAQVHDALEARAAQVHDAVVVAAQENKAALSTIIKLTDGALSAMTDDLKSKNEIISATDTKAIEDGIKKIEERNVH